MKEDVIDIRRRIPGEEFDYQALMGSLRGYASPRDKVTGLLKKGVIVRVKKGIYVFGQKYQLRPFSREILANIIHGPSYVSLDYALHYHGLIPERVEAVTSVTCGRGKRFNTPVGLFIYRTVPMSAYSTGISRVEMDGGRSFLIASPEKALADKLYTERGAAIGSQAELKDYLETSLRIGPEELAGLNAEQLAVLGNVFHSSKIQLLSRLAHRLGAERGHE